MALFLSPPTSIHIHSVRQPHHMIFSINPNFLYPIHLPRSSAPPASNSRRFRAVSPGPGRQPPPESEPPTGNDPPPSEGLATTFAKLQDTVQIFFAVLFWMSLFFWSSVWDGRNNDRPGKGSRFRR